MRNWLSQELARERKQGQAEGYAQVLRAAFLSSLTPDRIFLLGHEGMGLPLEE